MIMQYVHRIIYSLSIFFATIVKICMRLSILVFFKNQYNNLCLCVPEYICSMTKMQKLELQNFFKNVMVKYSLKSSLICRCDLCDKYSTSDPNLLRHHIRHAHVFNGPFRCGVCSKDIFGGRRVFRYSNKQEEKNLTGCIFMIRFINRIQCLKM